MQLLLAAWRVSLHRTRADWPIVTASGLICLLAATLLAAGPIYSSAVSIAGLHRQLESAPVTDANVEVSAGVEPMALADADVAIRNELGATAGSVGVDVVTSGVSDTFGLPADTDGVVRDLVTIGFLQGVQEHATLVSGAWPAAPAGDGPVEVAALEPLADLLGVGVGGRLRLESRRDSSRTLEAVVSAIYRPADPLERYWWDDPNLLEGLTFSEQYRTFGPLLTTPEQLLGSVVDGRVRVTWRGFIRVPNLQIEDMGPLRGRLATLPARVDTALPGGFTSTTTGLPQILVDADRALLVSRTGVTVLTIQLAILAAYAIVLTAGLIVEHRTMDTALLRSRGANPPQMALLALVEAALVALPAGIAAPWLAAAALRLMNVAGPLAGIGLTIEPAVTVEAYTAAAAGAVGCAVLLMVPAFLAARSYAAERAQKTRQETRSFGQRLGLDIALLAVTAIGLWQLRLYGAPITRTVQGSLGFDPLLVAAPAIGMLAGSVLALRLVPLLALAAERLVTRGRRLVGSLGVRQLARRPLRYTRASLLLMLAISMGVFAISYVSTWGRSQQDQADFQAGADLRVRPQRGPGALPVWALETAYGSLDGFTALTPVDRQSLRLSPSTPAGELIGLDGGVAGGIARLREDPTGAGMTNLLRPLADERPDPGAVPIPGTPKRLIVTATVAIDAIARPTTDDETGEVVMVPVDVAAVAPRTTIIASATVRDGQGLLHRLFAEPVTLAASRYELPILLVPATERASQAVAEAGAGFVYPIALVDVDFEVRLPRELVATAGRLGLDGVAASDASDGDTGQALDLDAANGWRLGWSQGPGGPLTVAPPELVDGLSLEIGGGNDADPGNQFATMPGLDRNGHGLTMSFTTAGITGLTDTELPAVVNAPFLEASGGQVGDRLLIPVSGATRAIRIAGIFEAFPTTAPEEPVAIVDLASLGLLRFAANRGTAPPSEWWLELDDAAAGGVLANRASGPLAGATVTSRSELRDRLSADPLALAMIGALSLGFVVAGVFAVVGLAVTAAVSVRQRRTEFALLRALGLSNQQLSGWLWLENGSLVVVSLVLGTGLGLAIGWVVLPFVTVSQDAGVPFPPVTVEVPWAAIGILELVTAIALVGTLLVLGRVTGRSGVGTVLRMGED